MILEDLSDECAIYPAAFFASNISYVDLSYSDLEKAQNLTIDQLSKVKTLHDAKLDEELEKPLREKYPALFKEPD